MASQEQFNEQLREQLMKRLKSVSSLNKQAGAPGPEHERLKSDLLTWAMELGFVTAYKRFKNDGIPDVLLENTSFNYLFCGDAKDAKNETCDNAETVQRIRGYFDEFVSVLGAKGFSGGRLAIATNSETEAKRWVPVLNALAQASNIVGVLTLGVPVPQEFPPNFTVIQIPGKNTWITYW